MNAPADKSIRESHEQPATDSAVPRADGAVLHVDFENYEDDLIGVLNAGVRWLGDPFTTSVKQKIIAIPRDRAAAFAGERCAHVFTDELDQKGRIILQRRHDAPAIKDEIAEFVFRPTAQGAADLEDFIVWSTVDAYNAPVGISLIAAGDKASGTYRIDIEDNTGERIEGVISDLPQSEWRRFLLQRDSAEGVVRLWAGKPGEEKPIGSFPDLDPESSIRKIELGDLQESSARGSGYWDDVRIGAALPAGQAPAPAETTRHIGTEAPTLPSPVVVTAERQLFVDGAIVQSSSGITRTFHPADKHPANPLLKPETPLEQEAKSVLPLSVHRDAATGAFRCWYAIWGKQVGKQTYQAVADSPDGLQWTRPSLGVLPEQGGNANLIRSGRMFRVQFDPSDPDPARRYKAVIRDAGFLAAFSPDGIRWKTASPVLSQAYDASSVHWDPIGRKWIASCKIWKAGKRSRGYAESTDFVNWTDTYFQYTADDKDGPQDQVYSMYIVRYESVYVGLIKIYHLDTDRCEIQVAFSRDAKHWQRIDRVPLIAAGDKPTDYDYGNLDPTDSIHRVGDQLYFFYSARSTRHNELPNDGSMGLATLRVDGFVSMDAGDAEAVIVTKPLVLKGKQLFLNADASRGEIRVEVLDARTHDTTADEAEVPVYPFTKDNAVALTADSTQHSFQWQNAKGLHVLRGQPVRLRFTLKHASLYSFWTQ